MINKGEHQCDLLKDSFDYQLDDTQDEEVNGSDKTEQYLAVMHAKHYNDPTGLCCILKSIHQLSCHCDLQYQVNG
jgi:hypothetical protein